MKKSELVAHEVEGFRGEASIETVTDDWAKKIGEVDSDLMGPARYGDCLNKGPARHLAGRRKPLPLNKAEAGKGMRAFGDRFSEERSVSLS